MRSVVAFAALALTGTLDFAAAGPCKPRSLTTTETTTGAEPTSTNSEEPLVVKNEVSNGNFAERNADGSITGYTVEGDVEVVIGDGYTGDGSTERGCAQMKASNENAPAGRRVKRETLADAALLQSISDLEVDSLYTVRFFYAIITAPESLNVCQISAYLGTNNFHTEYIFGSGQTISWNSVLTQVSAASTSAPLGISISCSSGGAATIYVDSIFLSNQVTPENIDEFAIDFGNDQVVEPVQTTSAAATQTTSEAPSVETNSQGEVTVGGDETSAPASEQTETSAAASEQTETSAPASEQTETSAAASEQTETSAASEQTETSATSEQTETSAAVASEETETSAPASEQTETSAAASEQTETSAAVASEETETSVAVSEQTETSAPASEQTETSAAVASEETETSAAASEQTETSAAAASEETETSAVASEQTETSAPASEQTETSAAVASEQTETVSSSTETETVALNIENVTSQTETATSQEAEATTTTAPAEDSTTTTEAQDTTTETSAPTTTTEAPTSTTTLALEDTCCSLKADSEFGSYVCESAGRPENTPGLESFSVSVEDYPNQGSSAECAAICDTLGDECGSSAYSESIGECFFTLESVTLDNFNFEAQDDDLVWSAEQCFTCSACEVTTTSAFPTTFETRTTTASEETATLAEQ